MSYSKADLYTTDIFVKKVIFAKNYQLEIKDAPRIVTWAQL